MSKKITCKQAVDYISKKEEGKLSSTQRFALWQHRKECVLCDRFAVQNKIIIKAASYKNIDTDQITPEEKEGIIKTALQRGL